MENEVPENSDGTPEGSTSSDLNLERGVEYYQSGNLREAKEHCRRLLAIDPNHLDALFLLGNIFLDEGGLEEAVSCYQKLLNINPYVTDAYSNIGVALQAQGKLDEAIAYCKKAVELGPDHAGALFTLGVSYQGQGNLDEAIACYRKVLMLFPEDVDASYNLGLSLQEQGIFENESSLDQALSCYRKVLECAPSDSSTLYNMGIIFKEQGKADEAVSFFKRCLDSDPQNQSAKHHLDAVLGENTEKAPPDYVRKLFDRYSKRFDHHLVERLEYRTPALLGGLLTSVVEGPVRFQNVIDLGCGTGLSGAEFRMISERLTGIDVSANMVREADAKGLYDVLEVTDMVDYLTNVDEKFDLFIAADVLVYFGNLDPVFAIVRKRITRDGYFLFSTEASQEEGYVLRETGRYAHSESYIRSLSKQHCFVVKRQKTETLRKEKGQSIAGTLYVLQAMH